MSIIKLPYQFKMREYQWESFDAQYINNQLREIWVWHRRAGKTKNIVNKLCAGAMSRVGNYYHTFPLLNQGRRNIWKGIDKEGKNYLDHFPKSIIKSVNNSDMSITFENNSTFQLVGADNYNVLMGGNPVGIVFDEFSLQNPLAWDYLRPILAENGGWAVFAFTPRGRNHAWQLLNSVRNNPKWFVSVKTALDTRDINGNRIITDEMIRDERSSGMSEEKIQQEFFCSFDYGVEGAYYSEQMKELYDNNRIKDFPINPNLKVYTWWDIGKRDSTAIWFFQKEGSELKMIYYYENNGKGCEFYFEKIKEFQSKFHWRYGGFFGPHDLNHSTWISNGQTGLEIARRHGINFQVVPNISIQDGIDRARAILPKMIFHETNCLQGIRCLQEYHKEYDEFIKVFKDKPFHNWASHGADGFRYFAVTASDSFLALLGRQVQSQGELHLQLE